MMNALRHFRVLRSLLTPILMMASFTLAPAADAQSTPVSLAVVNARIWTGDPKRPWAEAIAVRGDRIAAVGSSAEIRKLTGAGAKIVDAHGQMLVPGFIDAHVHFISAGADSRSVQLRDASTPAEFIARIKAFAHTIPKGAWITDGDWDHELWGGELPTREWIDAVTPDNPVWVADSTDTWSREQRRARGGARDARRRRTSTAARSCATRNGEPTGILKDNAQSLVDDSLPDPPAAVDDRDSTPRCTFWRSAA